MPYRQRLNMTQALPASESQQLISEFDAIRAELDDIRTIVSNVRALLVAGTAVGAGYNTTNTDPTNTSLYPKRLTAT